VAGPATGGAALARGGPQELRRSRKGVHRSVRSRGIRTVREVQSLAV